MATWVGVEGRDVFRDGEPGFNVVLNVNARYEEGAKRRARGIVTSRFPATWGNNEVVSVSKTGDSDGMFTEGWVVTVFVPTEGLRGAGAGTPLDAIMDVVNDRVIDPISDEIEDMRD